MISSINTPPVPNGIVGYCLGSFHCGFVHAIAVVGVAQGQDHSSESCGKGHAVVQQRLRKAILPCQKLRARQRQIEADLVQEPSFQQAQQQM